LMRNTPTKQLILFLVGSAINVALFCLSKYFGFPLWLDFAGSFYITVLCGPAYGLLSVVLHTATLAALIEGMSALWLLIPMLLAGGVIYTAGRLKLFSDPLGCVCSLFLATVGGFLGNLVIFLIRIPPTERYALYTGAFNAFIHSHGTFVGTVLGSAAISFAELIPCFLIFAGAYYLTPQQKSSLSFKK